DPDFRAGQAAVKAEQWPEAVTRLNVAIKTDPRNADAWNLLGFSYRHMGDMDNSFKHYEKALELNPRHRDAHEYVGEAYLQVGQLEGAEKHLKALDRLCWLPCEQYTDLKEKVEAYKRQAHATQGPAPVKP
ncbi:MAG: tetratricopeptide repeat protein, partial [Variovorax sp.]